MEIIPRRQPNIYAATATVTVTVTVTAAAVTDCAGPGRRRPAPSRPLCADVMADRRGRRGKSRRFAEPEWQEAI